MNIPVQIFEDILTQVVNRFLIPKYESLGMRTSGNWAEKLEVKNNVIRGEKYTEQLVYGRSAGSLPPINEIEKWVKLKFGYSGINARSTAWAVAKSIEKKGTTWKQKGGSDILEVLESKEVQDFINEKLGNYITTEITLQFQRNLQEL